MSVRTVLVVGGTGVIGAHVAADLAARGDRVTVASRRGSADVEMLAGLPELRGDYAEATFTVDDLAPFDSVVFAAGNDVRHVSETDEDGAFWARVQSEGVPRFVDLARRAGVERVVQVGSCYHQLQPGLVEESEYVAARAAADERSRALSRPGFDVITVNPPPIVGSIPGRVQRRFARMVDWIRGGRPEVPRVALPGGTNYMSVRSLSQAIASALDRGEPGRADLVGDENLSYQQYFQMLAAAAGANTGLPVVDQEHPFQPDRFIVQGRGAVIAYEPDPAEVELLGYDRQDIRRALDEIVQAVDTDNATIRKGDLT